VSFASAFCSVLAIWFTYLLGAAAWSRPVGLLAALGLSLDHDVLTLASRGWRDDTYAAVVAGCAFLMLRCWRVGRAPVRFRQLGRVRLDAVYVEAVILGIASGIAVLTRIMAVPFLAAGGAFLVFGLPTPWRRRLTMAGIAVATALIVAGPYFVDCWRVYGDPLYTFNVHGNIYSIRQGEGEWKGSTAEYVAHEIAERPIAAVDTILQGVTTYPFANKWHGLDRWFAGLAHWASVAAIVGLVVLAAFAPGRLLLIATWASLLPFSFTWPSDPDFRFTVHAYPTFLVAAAVGIAAVFHTARAILVPTRLPEKRPEWRRRALAWAAVVGPAVVLLWLVLRVLPTWTFTEALRTGEAGMLTAGIRDGAFVGSGWSEVTGRGNVRMRIATTEGTIWLPLPAVADYPMSDPPRSFPATARHDARAAPRGGGAPQRRAARRDSSRLDSGSSRFVHRHAAANHGAARIQPPGAARAASRPRCRSANPPRPQRRRCHRALVRAGPACGVGLLTTNPAGSSPMCTRLT
jgi:hypothetical protein